MLINSYKIVNIEDIKINPCEFYKKKNKRFFVV